MRSAGRIEEVFDLDTQLTNVPLTLGDWQGEEVPENNLYYLTYVMEGSPLRAIQAPLADCMQRRA